MRVTSATALARAAQRKADAAARRHGKIRLRRPLRALLARPGPPRAPPARINTTPRRASRHSSPATRVYRVTRRAISYNRISARVQ